METLEQKQAGFKEGMLVSDLRESTSIGFINSLRENELIEITKTGKIRLTAKGKIASRWGIENFLKMAKIEKEFFNKEINNMKVEKRGLLMIFGGMFISLLLIIGFWAIQLKAF